jgi:hypothetical protein
MTMNIDDGKKSRAALKTYFVKNAIPTEQQFAQLIDSAISQRDDGLVKLAGDPLCIEAAGDDTSFKKALNFYSRFADADPAWTISLRPRSTPGDPLTGRAGLSINDASGNSCLAIDAETKNVGVGVIKPGERLEVDGRVKAGKMVIGTWPHYGGVDGFVGVATLDHNELGNYALLQQGKQDEFCGRTLLNSPVDIEFRIANEVRAQLDHAGNLKVSEGNLTVSKGHLTVGKGNLTVANGNVGIGVAEPSERLEVDRRLKVGGLTLGSWPTEDGYAVVGASANLAAGYALLVGVSGKNAGITYVNAALDLRFRIAAAEQMIITQDGNVGIGTTAPQEKLDVRGNIRASGRIYNQAADLAEIYFSHAALSPGDVVSLDPDSDRIVASPEANCGRVIGVVSTEPAVLLNSPVSRDGRRDDGSAGHPVALTGCVPCKVTDEGGPIRRGDLLTSASRPGYAMRATPVGPDGPDGTYRTGTIIGKALGPHDGGEGSVDIFVMLR